MRPPLCLRFRVLVRRGRMRELPAELWLEVLEWFVLRSAFSELARAGEVCRQWRSLVDKVVPAWCAAQAGGQRSGAFGTESSEMELVRRHADGESPCSRHARGSGKEVVANSSTQCLRSKGCRSRAA